MPGIYFIHTQTLPTIHPDIEAFITFRGTAVIDEELRLDAAMQFRPIDKDGSSQHPVNNHRSEFPA